MEKTKTQLLAVFGLLLFLVLMPQPVIAQFDDPISEEDQATFDQILEPVMKIYNLVKYVATFIAALFLLFVGLTYIMSGSDPRKRDNAKAMAMYVIVGLVIIWAAPLVVQFVVG